MEAAKAVDLLGRIVQKLETGTITQRANGTRNTLNMVDYGKVRKVVSNSGLVSTVGL